MAGLAGRLFSYLRSGAAPADLSWLTPDLARSERFTVRESHAIARAGIRAVLDLRPGERHNLQPLGRAGLHYLHLAIGQDATPTVDEIARAAGWVRHELDDERKVLVHCREASSGSATIIAATLVHLGHPLPQAIELLAAGTLNEGQLDVLRRYADTVGR